MSVQETKEKKPKVLSAEQLERKRVKDQIETHKKGIKELEERLAKMTPAKKPKSKIVLTENMRTAQLVGNQLKQMVDEEKDGKPTGKKIPKRVASRTEFRSACAKIVGINDINKELARGQVYSVVVEGLALLDTMPKPPKKPRVPKSE